MIKLPLCRPSDRYAGSTRSSCAPPLKGRATRPRTDDRSSRYPPTTFAPLRLRVAPEIHDSESRAQSRRTSGRALRSLLTRARSGLGQLPEGKKGAAEAAVAHCPYTGWTRSSCTAPFKGRATRQWHTASRCTLEGRKTVLAFAGRGVPQERPFGVSCPNGRLEWRRGDSNP